MPTQLPLHQQPWAILGAPLEGTGQGRGEVRTPALLRAAGIRDRLDAIDHGDLEVPVGTRVRDTSTGVTGYGDIVNGSRKIRDAVAAALSTGHRPLVLGGCCSVLPGAFAGARSVLGRTGLLFVDGHLDLHTGQTSNSGNLAGMALAVVLGQGADELVHLHPESPMLRGEDLVAVGYDANDPDIAADTLQKMAPQALGISAPQVVETGAARVGKNIARKLRKAGVPVWLHLDVDVLDSSVMPAVSYPGPTGITWQMLVDLLEPVVRDVPLAGIVIADFNADLDDYGDYARAIIGLLGDTAMIKIRTNSDTYRVPDTQRQRSWTAQLHDLVAALLVLR